MSEVPGYVEDVCKQLALDKVQCNVLNTLLPKLCHCPKPEKGEKGEKARQKSRWQECISLRRHGQPFNPDAIKELAKEYRAGKCP